ncbi:MAG: orotate phosphoribosyltransferase [Candidatus Bathyarchaeota archaeon]|nr:orotate phosphoribosyltransferase [Candidatus Bathyarchaeota archaeon]
MAKTKKTEMAKILTKIDALQFGLFDMADGKVSPYYIDLRVIPSFPDAFKDICALYEQTIKKKIGMKSFDRIAGIPLAGLPFASQVAYNLGKPFLYVRKEDKGQGRERRVEGVLVSGERVLLVDDLTTTGLTLGQAAESVRAEGGVVVNAVSLLDREEGAKEKLNQKGIDLQAVLKISEVAKSLYEMGTIDEESLNVIMKQIKKKKANQPKR